MSDSGPTRRARAKLRRPLRDTNGTHREDVGWVDDNFAPVKKGRW